jgi:hypothetical protein
MAGFTGRLSRGRGGINSGHGRWSVKAPESRCQKFHRKRTNRLRAGQNAAVLLFNFRTVDIRRVGTQIRRILVVGCSE